MGEKMSKEHLAELKLNTVLKLPKTFDQFSIDIWNEQGTSKRGTLYFGQGGVFWKPKRTKYRIGWSELANLLDNHKKLT